MPLCRFPLLILALVSTGVVGASAETAVAPSRYINPIPLPDYPVGHMIAFQVEEQVRKTGHLGDEFERMASYGNVTPDMWMKHATGEPVGPEAMLRATKQALPVFETK